MDETSLLNELKGLSIDTSKPIPEYLNTYAVNYKGLLGVAVETNCKVNINERFNNVTLTKALIKREDASRDVILLYANKNEVNNFFIKLCCVFLKDYKLVSENPIEWYEGWRNILGNKKTSKMVYDVIAELKILLYLHKNNDHPNLDSENKGTFDISAKSGFYEVKASILKSQEVVTIHNQYQLDTKLLDRPLYITYCKVEQNNSGDSINSLLAELKNSSYDIRSVINYLEELGYYEGSLDRDKKYLFHEVRLYEVNDNFPKISDKSFVEGKFPSNIVKIEYTVSLDGLDYKKII